MAKAEPHLEQTGGDYLTYEGKFTRKDRVLNEDAPGQPYEATRGIFSALHWGQRKLLMSEVEFLTNHSSKASLVVYAGAAAGYHIPFLAALFPSLTFHLYDPAPFAIKKTDRIQIYQEKMTKKIARRYRYAPRDGGDENASVLFISDIRTVDNPDKITDSKARTKAKEEYPEEIAGDLERQLSWSRVMQLVRSMVKFKLPYTDGTTIYPQGKIYLPVWGKQTTTESRLVYANSDDLIGYDHRIYEEQMAYFNNRTLLTYYPHSYIKEYLPVGMDNCYSCRSELFIWDRYVKSIYPDISKELRMLQVKSLSEGCSAHLTTRTNVDLATEWKKEQEDQKAGR